MIIDDFDGETVTDSWDEIDRILRRRPAFDANHYVFTFDDDGFPQLSAFVRGDRCVLSFLGGGAYVAVSQGDDVGAGGTVTFFENATGARVEIAAECVVGIASLRLALEDFCERRERSPRVRWTEL